MAAVLEGYLAGQISSKTLVLWLSSDRYMVDTENSLFSDRSLRAEFLPFFINYLRDQTSHLVCHGIASGASPAKTPASAQKFRRSSLQRQTSSDGLQLQESSSRGTQRRLNRTQLFSSSPIKSDASEGTVTPKSFCSEDGSPLSVSAESNPLYQGGQFYQKTPLDEYKGKTKKVSPSLHKKDEHITLGQYIKPDGLGHHLPKGRRRSDQHHLKENGPHKTPVNSKRRSGGRGSKISYSDGSLRSKSKPVFQDFVAPEFVLNSSDDFPIVGSPATVPNTPTRRITPTALTSHQKSLTTPGKWQHSASPLFPQSGREEPPILNPAFQKALSTSGDTPNLVIPAHSSRGLQKERELLRLERLKQQANIADPSREPSSSHSFPGSSPLRPQTPTKSSSTSAAFTYPSEFVKASRDEVTYQYYVDKLAELYSACTKECLMPNLTIELYFLVHLLTARGSLSSTESIDVNKPLDAEDINYLCSIHNCVQFAVSVLDQQFWLLTFLDKTTLRLLAEVPSLSDFSPALKSRLDATIDRGSTRPVMVTSKSPVQAVPFLADTDNRQNFPSEVAFHSFKKQRDKFYELVREWLDHHNIPGWSMQAAMSKKIRDLVRQIVEVANCTHFARLFSSQLTRMCQGDHLISDHRDSGKERGFLGDLKKTNPEKFKKLEERFSTPMTSGGPSPPPAFHGCQEFFKEFIVAADSFLFNQHLIDNFSSKIIELNEMQFGLNDQDGDPESNGVDDEVCSSFSSSLQAARVLAKFLGFLVFLPYQGGNSLPESVQSDVIALRNKCCPPVDVFDSLRASCSQQRLVMTVPWVVEYLSMMDPIAAQLESCQVVLALMVQVYRKVSRKLSSDPASYNMLLVLLVLGWLFEIPGLPASMYFTSFGDDFVFDDLLMEQTATNTSLDNLPLVDQQLLYLCCPYLGDIRVLLADASLGLGSKTTPMKKITPIAANTPPKPIQTAQQLQQDLEKNFFDNHSPSLKKTVDFVSSRLASNCIKHIDAKLVSVAREKVMALLEAEVRSEEVAAMDEDWSSEMKRALLRRVKARGEEIATATRQAAEQQAKQFVLRRSRDALSLLLPEETSDQVLEAAAYITGRLAMERAMRWIVTQVQAAIQQELSSGVDRAIRAAKKEAVEKPKFTLPGDHDKNVHSPSAVLQQYKDMLRYLLTGSTSHDVTLDEVARLLMVTGQALCSRQDLTPLACQMIQQLSMELVSALAVFRPAYLGSSIPIGNAPCDLSSVRDESNQQGSISGNDDRDFNGKCNVRLDKNVKSGGHISSSSQPSELNLGPHCANEESAVNGAELTQCFPCSTGEAYAKDGFRRGKDTDQPALSVIGCMNGCSGLEDRTLGDSSREEPITECLSLKSANSGSKEASQGFKEQDLSASSKICHTSPIATDSSNTCAHTAQNGSNLKNKLNLDDRLNGVDRMETEMGVSGKESPSDSDKKNHWPAEKLMTTLCSCPECEDSSNRSAKRTDSDWPASPDRGTVSSPSSSTRITGSSHQIDRLDYKEPAEAGQSGVTLSPHSGCRCDGPRSSVRVLDTFVELWRDHFRCQVPAQVFLCPRNALLIQPVPNAKECWDCIGHVVCTLLARKLTDSAKVIECLTHLLQSEHVNVTEAVATTAWVIAQRLEQEENPSLSETEGQASSPLDIRSLLHILMARCPDGNVLQQLCHYVQHHFN